MRRRSRPLVLLFLLILAAAYGSFRALDEGWSRLTGFTPPHATTVRPSSGPPQLAERVVLILVDGLRSEDAARLPSLDWLLRQGSGYRLQAPEPAYPLAAALTALTGAHPGIHGALVALPGQAVAVDTLPAAAGRGGLTTGGAGSVKLGSLLGPAVQTWYPALSAEALLSGAQALLHGPDTDLVIIHIPDQMPPADGAPETEGAGLPPVSAGERRLAELDAHLVQILELFDLEQTAVLVTGTVPTGADGRHEPGAPVPLILAGAGVHSGVRGEGSLKDVAPTAAALLGAPTPLQAQGKPLMAVLEADGRPADVIAERYMASRKAFADAVLVSLDARGPTPDPPATAAEMDAYLRTLEAQLREARFTQWKASLLGRLPYVVGVMLLLLLYVVVVWRQPFGGAAFLSAVAYAALFHAGFYLNGGGYSGSMRGLGTGGWSALLRPGMAAAAAVILAAMLYGFLLSRREGRRERFLTAATLHWLLSTAAVIALPVAGAVLLVGWEFPVELPSIGLTIWFLVTAVQALVITAGSPVWTLVATVAGRTAGRLWPPPEVGNPEENADKVVRLRVLRRSTRTETRWKG